MACVWVEGFEQPGYTTAMYLADNVLAGSTGGFMLNPVTDPAQIVQPLASPDGNGSRALRVGSAANINWRVNFQPTVTQGILSFICSNPFLQSMLFNGQRWLRIFSSTGGNIIDLIGASSATSTTGYTCNMRLFVGTTEVSTISMDLSGTPRFSIAYETSGTAVTRVTIYRNEEEVHTWTGSIVLPSVTAVAFGGGAASINTGSGWVIDSITLWDDPDPAGPDVPMAIRPHWVFGRTVSLPASPTQGDWASFLDATSPSGDIAVQVAAAQSDRGALTVTADAELELAGFSPFPAGVDGDVYGVALYVRGQGSASLVTMEAYIKSGAVDGVPVQESLASGGVVRKTYALDPDGNVPWTLSSAEASTIGIQAKV